MATLNASARNTATTVKEIISVDAAITDSQINNFINAAYLLMTQADLANKGLGEDILTEIEKWLAAHFLATLDPRTESEEFVDVWRGKYQGKTGKGLEATIYGQQALALDTSGSLASAGLKRATVEVYSRYVDVV